MNIIEKTIINHMCFSSSPILFSFSDPPRYSSLTGSRICCFESWIGPCGFFSPDRPLWEDLGLYNLGGDFTTERLFLGLVTIELLLFLGLFTATIEILLASSLLEDAVTGLSSFKVVTDY